MKRLVIFTAVLLLMYGCTEGKDTSQDEVVLKHVVIQYNNLLAEGYRNLNMTELSEVATEERAMKAYYHMSALGEARTKMDSKLQKIDFLDIKFLSSIRAEVRTREVWDYIHINIDTEKVTLENSVTYELKYTIINQSDRWLVSNIDVLTEEEEKDGEQ